MTNDQAGHEFVKAEAFLVPVGSIVVIKGLEFETGSSTLTGANKLIVQQIFNSIEEITENTVNDTNSARVARFKKMQFEIRAYDDANSPKPNPALAEERAKAVMDFLTYLGTPPWRLKATGIASHDSRKKHGDVEFVRTR